MSSCDPIGLRSRTTNGAVEGERLGSGRVVGKQEVTPVCSELPVIRTATFGKRQMESPTVA
jgi:hypothetical protein